MTKREWIDLRQSRSTVPWKDIEASGWDAVPCRCRQKGCQGWKLARVEKPSNPRSLLNPSEPPEAA